MPKLAGHMEEEGVLPTMYCSQWFLTLYAYTLPIDHLLRVWDVFLLEGPKVLFRFAYTVSSSMHLADHFFFCRQYVATHCVCCAAAAMLCAALAPLSTGSIKHSREPFEYAGIASRRSEQYF